MREYFKQKITHFKINSFNEYFREILFRKVFNYKIKSIQKGISLMRKQSYVAKFKVIKY